MLLSHVFLVLLFVNFSNSQWLNCSQVDFCERLRYQPRNNTYSFYSLIANQDSVSGLIAEVNYNSTYNLTLNIITGGAFRVVIDDIKNPRHRVLDALDGGPKKEILNVTDLDGGYEISSNLASVLLFRDPFKLIFLWRNTTVAIIDTSRLVFEDEPLGAIALEFLFPGAQKAYGLPEHADHFSLRDTVNNTNPYRLYNIDNYGYETESTQALYGSVPVLYAHSTERTSGVFWHNSAQTFVDISRDNGNLYSYFISESGVIDFFVLSGPGFKETVQQYANLTGNKNS